MKKYIGFVTAFVLTTVVLAQDATVPASDFIADLIKAITSSKGLSTMAIVAVVVQLLIKFMNTDWANSLFKSLSGAMKLVVVHGLTLIASVVGMMLQGSTLLQALSSGVILTALMVYGNEIYQNFFVSAPKA